MKRTFKRIGVGLALIFGFFVVVDAVSERHSDDTVSVVRTNSQVLDEALEETVIVAEEKHTSVPNTPSSSPQYRVTKVVDGDTLAIDRDGEVVTIRLIGLDTPETVHPSKQVECFGAEASDAAKRFLTDEWVRLETDPSQGEYDKYGRLLAYVFLSDGTLFNQYMIEEGYGHEYTYNTPYTYQASFRAAEATARTEKKGLWADGACKDFGGAAAEVRASQVTASPNTKPSSSQSASVVGGYSCSSNIYNCSDFSTHAEAQQAYELCGGVTNDIHRLDREKDGFACESLP